jgi:hypothetical protein
MPGTRTTTTSKKTRITTDRPMTTPPPPPEPVGPRSGGAEDRRAGAVDRRAGVDRRSGLERRRGPGRRRSDMRRSAEEGEMSQEQFEFVMAIDEYKRMNNRPFPTWTEVLEVIKYLGYRKVAPRGEHVDRPAPG